ncbi:hypothetical protein RQP46_001397 [Phenoliferia psychrophenolica]
METTPFRLHISGLAPTTKPADLVSRFTSFGSIVDGENGVGGLGTDANGLPRTFAFVTLETTKAKLAKCTSMLSGSMWKGHKLRIALAKPDYMTQMAAEREALQNGTAKGPKRKKRKANPDPNIGEMARRFELVTADNCAKHSGWTLDPSPTPAPLFPLLTRPSHPLPPLPSKPASTSWTRETLRAKTFREKKEAKRLANPAPPPSRARRVRIDVRKWGRTKKVFDGTESKGEWEVKGGWECVEAEEGGEGEARWVFKGLDGSIKREETIRLGRTDAYTDSFASLLSALAGPTPIPSTTDASSSTTPAPPAAPRVVDFATFDIPGALDTTPRLNRPKSLSPPPYVPLAPRTLLYNEEDAFALRTTTIDEEEAEEGREMERRKQLDVLRALVGGAPTTEETEDVVEEVPATVVVVAPGANKRAMPAVEGFGDEDDEEEFQEVLRLRGGGPDDDEEWEEPSGEVMRLRGGGGDESEDDSDDDEEPAAAMEVEPATATEPAAKTTLSFGTLKDMFKPQEASTSFSLLGDLDLDLAPLSRTPSPEPTSYPIYRAPAPHAPSHHPSRGGFVPPPALGTGGHNRAWIGTGPLTPFFAFPSSSKYEKEDGSIVAPKGVEMEVAEKAMVESRKRLGDAASAFWRSESTEKIEEEHQKLREVLRGHARKRHREASKRGRKKTAAGGSSRKVGGGGAEGE